MLNMKLKLAPVSLYPLDISFFLESSTQKNMHQTNVKEPAPVSSSILNRGGEKNILLSEGGT